MKIGLILAASLTAVAALAFAPPEAKKDEAHPAPKPHAGFDQLKALAGTWETADDDKDGKPDGTMIYKVTSGGHAVCETLFPGTPHEMITMYHLDGKAVICTHYCALGNQPRMRCDNAEAGKPMVFKFQDACNMASPNDAHMGGLTVTFTDADHIVQEWKHFKDGKEGGTAKFAWTRKSK